MEHIDGRIVRHDLLHIGKGIEEEVEKLLRCHVVVFDFSGAALIVHIVGRVGDDEVCLAAIHEGGVGLLFGTVTADEPVPSQRPDVAGLGEGRLLQLGTHIEIVFLDVLAVIEQLTEFLLIKAGEQRVKVRRLQGFDFYAQEFFIPACVHRHTVVCNDIRFLLGFGEMVGKDARHLRDTFLLGGKNTTVAGNYAIVTVDDNGIDEAELPQGGAELVDLLRAVCSGIIDIGNKFADGDKPHFCGCFHQISPHSANFSKPPTERM